MKNLKETSDRIFIENIPRLEWGKNNDISFIKSAQLALNSIGENYNYEFLMGISGAAFRFHFHPDWCPSASDFTTGFDVSKVLFKSLGYNYEFYSIDDNSFDEIRTLYHKIIDQINKGIPIIAINLKVYPEWGIITGYLKNRPGILCRTYFDESDGYSLAEHAPWLSVFINEKFKPYSEEKLIKNSFQIAVQIYETEKFGDYYSGINGFNKWIGHLNKYAKLKELRSFEHHEVNLTLLYYLLDARRAAFEYLSSMNYKLELGQRIIKNYENIVRLLEDTAFNHLPSFDSNPGDWTKSNIIHQIEVLTEIREIEKETIVLIKKEI